MITFRNYVPFFLFFVLTLLTLPFGSDFATSVVPGWHSMIFSPYFIASIVVTIILILVTATYWIRARRSKKTNWTLFGTHFILTVPIVLFFRTPTLLIPTEWTNFTDFEKQNQHLAIIVLLICTLFIIGQLIFAFSLTRRNGLQT
jgi:hypothetical protein